MIFNSFSFIKQITLVLVQLELFSSLQLSTRNIWMCALPIHICPNIYHYPVTKGFTYNSVFDRLIQRREIIVSILRAHRHRYISLHWDVLWNWDVRQTCKLRHEEWPFKLFMAYIPKTQVHVYLCQWFSKSGSLVVHAGSIMGCVLLTD